MENCYSNHNQNISKNSPIKLQMIFFKKYGLNIICVIKLDKKKLKGTPIGPIFKKFGAKNIIIKIKIDKKER